MVSELRDWPPGRYVRSLPQVYRVTFAVTLTHSSKSSPTLYSLCVERPSHRQYPNPQKTMPLNILDFLYQSWIWLAGIVSFDNIMRLVSLRALSFRVFTDLISRGNEGSRNTGPLSREWWRGS